MRLTLAAYRGDADDATHRCIAIQSAGITAQYFNALDLLQGNVNNQQGPDLIDR